MSEALAATASARAARRGVAMSGALAVFASLSSVSFGLHAEVAS